MYIRNNLLKHVNETYYRYFQDTDMKPLSEDYTAKDINHNLRYISSDENEGILELQDLYNITFARITDVFSKYAMELSCTQNYYEELVAKNLPTSDVYNEVVNILTEESTESFIVGGSVRDAILSIPSSDTDIVSDISISRLKVLFKAQGYGIKEEGVAHRVLIVSKNGEMYEISQFRKDVYVDNIESDGRHPDSVEVGDIKTDSRRRDFTINSLYYNLTTNKLIDPTGNGIDDIGNNLLRFVGNPSERIREDYLRTWRAFRLAKTKGLKLERKTEKALRAHFDESYKNSNTQRVLQEMIKMTS